MIKNILFDMGGVIFRQNSEEAFRRFREAGVDTVSFAGEWLRLPGANLSVGMRRNIAGWALYVMCL